MKNSATLLTALLLALAGAPAGATSAGLPSLVVMEPEIEGDVSNVAMQEAWEARLDMLGGRVAEGLTAGGVYALADPEPARELFAKYRRRHSVHACEVCATDAAAAVEADRVLSLYVHRMSNLVLTLHALLRDGETGNVRYARALSFRGDNDRSWRKAADYLVRDMAAIPLDKR